MLRRNPNPSVQLDGSVSNPSLCIKDCCDHHFGQTSCILVICAAFVKQLKMFKGVPVPHSSSQSRDFLQQQNIWGQTGRSISANLNNLSEFKRRTFMFFMLLRHSCDLIN
ncbi:hypothetical protein GOODEAATRI_009646 [Goodea atripinnis]|uniref:Uncharacterized protein n=1 Tax=Goodea atripinnis TaxID=208336 RepID=A0ABV0PCS3_9TELE